jgi:mannose-6-phosphate isomerase-like protein (cupin superfamily)
MTTERRQTAIVRQPGEGEAIWFLDSRMTVKVTGRDTHGGFGLTETLVPPGFSPPTHIHHGEDESFYVLEGELTIRCGDDTYSAPASSFAFLPRDVPHSFVAEGDTPVRMLGLMTPGGGEGFFIELGRPAEHVGIPDPAPIDVAELRGSGRSTETRSSGPRSRHATGRRDRHWSAHAADVRSGTRSRSRTRRPGPPPPSATPGRRIGRCRCTARYLADRGRGCRRRPLRARSRVARLRR